MAGILDGAQIIATPEDKRSHTVHGQFTKDVWAVWKQHQAAEAAIKAPERGLSPPEFYRTTVVSFLHMAAVVGHDTGLTKEQILAMATFMYDEVRKQAPKFS